MKQFKTKISILLGTCLFAFLATGQTNTFNYSGAIQTYIVPTGVAKIQITAVGAAGGTGINASFGNGGSGASMQGIFDVTPGQALSVLVGGKGTDGADYVGGGGGGEVISSNYNGGGGGGSFNTGALQVNLTSIGNDNGVVTISAVAFVGINEINAIQVALFPNPTTGKLTVSATAAIQMIEIGSLTGQVVATYSETNSIDISELINGVYIAKITTVNNKTTVKRIVKK